MRDYEMNRLCVTLRIGDRKRITALRAAKGFPDFAQVTGRQDPGRPGEAFRRASDHDRQPRLWTTWASS